MNDRNHIEHRLRFALLLFCMVLVVAGCTGTSTMSWQQLQAEVSKHPDDNFAYCGSKDGYDYFHLLPGLLSDPKAERDYRVSSAKSPLAIRRNPFSDDRSTWVSYEAAAGLLKQ